MAMGDVIARLSVQLGLETAAFEKGATIAEKRMAQSAKSFEKMGKKMGDMGKTLSLTVTAPLVAFGYTAAKAAAESRDAMAQVTASLKSMGPVAGKTEKDLQKLAKALQYTSTFDDDEILRKVTANLLTFGKVSGKVFDRAQQVIVDYAAKSGKGLQEVTIMVGKALQDPAKGLAALSKVGVQFTDAQKAQIQSMLAVNDVAGAQAIILGELKSQTEGSAKAARDAVPGSDAINKWNDFQESIGETLLVAFERIEPYLNKLLDFFVNLSPPMQTALVIFAGIAAALGPILLVLGPLVTMMAPFLGAIKAIAATQGVMAALGGGLTGLATTLAPILLVVGAIYLAWKNWDKIAPMFAPLLEQLGAIAEGLGLIEAKAGKSAEEIARTESYKKFGQELLILNGKIETFYRSIGKASDDSAAATRKAFISAGQTLNGYWSSLKSGAAGADAAIRGFASSAVASVNNMVSAIGRAITGRLSDIWDRGKAKVEEVREMFFNLWDKVTRRSYIPDMVDEIGVHMRRLQEEMVDPAAKATKAVSQAMRDMQQKASAILRELYPELARAQDMADRVAAIKGGSGLKGAALDDALRREGLLQTTGSPNRQFGDIPISKSILDAEPLTDGMKDAGKALEDLQDKAKVKTVRIAKSFKDMAEGTIGALRNMTDAIKGGGFLGILEGIIGLGLQLGSIGAFGKKIAGNINKPVPGYADGTNFHPGGMAMVGERGPELVKMPRGSQVFTNRESMAMGGGGKFQVEVVANNNGFGAMVRNQAGQVVAAASPSLMQGGAQIATSRLSRRQSRSI